MINQADIKSAVNDAILYALSNLHTATIAKVSTVSSKTIDCEPVISRNVDGRTIKLPTFKSVPPVFMSGGSSYTAHPISAGDYCLLIFTERCFDRWYSGNDFELPAEYRMHDYSDGLAIVGLFPFASAIEIPSVITQIGDSYKDGNTVHDGDLSQTGDISLTGSQVITGNLTVQINITAPMATINGPITCQSITVNGIDFGSHVHGGVEPGSGTTGGPQ